MSRDGRRHIVAVGGGGFVGGRPGPLIDFILSLTSSERPRFCRIGTAGGDSAEANLAFYSAFAGTPVIASHLNLFTMPNVDPREHLLAQDAVWVGGGSVANLLAVWRVHGLDDILRDAWEQGVVLSGVSAGSLCWFLGGTTDSFGPDLRPVTNGLGLLQHSNCPHYDSEEQRRPLYQRLVGDGTLPAGWAADDGVGLHFIDEDFAEAVADRPGARGYRVERRGDAAVETPVEPRLL